jgi:hypothetical protein
MRGLHSRKPTSNLKNQIETLARRNEDRMNLMYRYSSLQGALLAGVLLCAAVCSADTTPAPSEVSVSGKERSGSLVRTLAVLAEGPIGRSSVPDLLFVQLANVPHLSLLERDETDRAAAELSLSAGSAAQSVVARLRLGSTVGADVLVLLRLQYHEGNPFLISSVVDTHYGAVLSKRISAFGSAKSDELSAMIAAQVKAVWQKHPNGIQELICVPHLECLNLGHEFEALQTTYADFLTELLNTYPGVAALDTEEGRNISRELGLQGRDLRARKGIQFLKGKFRHDRGRDGAADTVSLSFALQIGGRTVELGDYPAVEAANLPECFGKVVVRAMAAVRKGTGSKGVDIKAHVQQLLEAAEEFAAAGQWRESLRLRESALLVSPGNAALRVRLTREYNYLLAEDFPGHLLLVPGKGDGSDNPEYEAECARRYVIYNRVVSHSEYLIRNRLVDVQTALELTPWKYAFDNCYPSSGVSESDAKHKCEAKRQEYLNCVFPLIRDLPLRYHNKFYRREITARWLRKGEDLSGYALDRLSGHPEAKQFRKRMAEWVKAGVGVVKKSVETNSSDRAYPAATEAVPVPQDMNSIAPQLLAARIQVAEPRDGLMAAGAKPSRQGTMQHVSDAIALQKLQFTLKRVDGTTRPYDGSGRLWSRRGYMLGAQGEVVYGRKNMVAINQHVRCSEELDVFLGPGAVLFEKEKGILEEVLVDERAYFETAVWCGNYVWVASRLKGIYVLRPDGSQVAHLSLDQGLPSSDGGIVLHSVGPSRVVAVAKFGKRGRCWLAHLEATADGVQHEIFWEARTVLPHRRTRNNPLALWRSPALAFHPTWIREFKDKPGILYIGRGDRYPFTIWPLTVSLKDWSVAVDDSPGRRLYRSHSRDVTYYEHHQKALDSTGDGSDYIFKHVGRPETQEYEKLVALLGVNGLSGHILKSDNLLVMPGKHWTFLDLESRRLARHLVAFPPPRYSSVSAHHGLIVWSYGGAMSEVSFARERLFGDSEVEEPAFQKQ